MFILHKQNVEKKCPLFTTDVATNNMRAWNHIHVTYNDESKWSEISCRFKSTDSHYHSFKIFKTFCPHSSYLETYSVKQSVQPYISSVCTRICE